MPRAHGLTVGNTEVRGARENNLKNISLEIPRRQITVVARADWVLDMGPGAGDEGGKVVFEDVPAKLVKERRRSPAGIWPNA